MWWCVFLIISYGIVVVLRDGVSRWGILKDPCLELSYYNPKENPELKLMLLSISVFVHRYKVLSPYDYVAVKNYLKDDFAWLTIF